MSSYERVPEIIEEFDRTSALSGVIRISDRGGFVFEKAFGFASVQLEVSNTIGTKFHIASMTKMFIAAAVMRLIDAGLADRHDHPARYHRDFQSLDSRITLHHLLSNTSGLADIYAIPDLRLAMEHLVRDGTPFSAYLASMAQLFSPGDRWSYSSTGFLILCYVIEAIRSQPFGTAVREMFLDPLGMHNTGEDDPMTVNPGRAYGHVTRDGTVWNAENDRLSGIPAPREFFSTAPDLDLWSQAFLNGQILSPEAERLTFSSYGTTDFDPNLGYGYGWFLGKDFRLIGGGTPGFRSELWQYPGQGLCVIMLWNNQAIDSHRLFWKLRPALRL